MEKQNSSGDMLIFEEALNFYNAIKGEKEKENPLSIEIRKAVSELNTIREYYDYIDEPELVEYAIYREKAVLIRLSYLIKKAKDQNLKSYPCAL